MIKTLAIAAIIISGLMSLSTTASAAGRGRRYTGGTPYVAQSAGGGYRSYSYEPGLAPGRVAAPYSRPSSPFSGFHSAGWKITGR